MRTRDEPGDDSEKALISSLAHSTQTHALPSIKQSDIHLEATLSPPQAGPACFQKKALLIGIQYYNSTNAQLDSEDSDSDRLGTPAGEQIKGPHLDVENMRQFLLGKAFCHYHVPLWDRAGNSILYPILSYPDEQLLLSKAKES